VAEYAFKVILTLVCCCTQKIRMKHIFADFFLESGGNDKNILML
jgi:hypothetical protein